MSEAKLAADRRSRRKVYNARRAAGVCVICRMPTTYAHCLECRLARAAYANQYKSDRDAARRKAQRCVDCGVKVERYVRCLHCRQKRNVVARTNYVSVCVEVRKTCVCGDHFVATHKLRKHCSVKCRDMAYQIRKAEREQKAA